MSNPSSNQKRSLQPTSSTQGAYSASPSQLTLSSDLPSGLGHPYQQGYGYPQDPSPFAFPPHPQYRQQLQTQGLPTHQQQQQQHQHQHHQQPSSQSPINSRKRRPSELELPGSSSSNASAFGHPTGLSGGGGGELDVLGQPQNPLASPVAKKGRTNTPWTPAEEQRLKTLRDAGASWSEIAKTFPTRTEGSVKKHWYKDMHYAEFGEDEAIKDYENNKWKVIGQKVGKPAKACEQFAKEQGWKV